MALANAVAGATRPSQVITWQREDGNPEILTGATLTGKLYNKRTGVTQAIAGDLSVTDAANGVFTWDYDAADVATAGEYSVQFTAAFGASPSPARTIETDWTVLSALP